jgi:ubiquitin C-terminal hydrolase
MKGCGGCVIEPSD